MPYPHIHTMCLRLQVCSGGLCPVYPAPWNDEYTVHVPAKPFTVMWQSLYTNYERGLGCSGLQQSYPAEGSHCGGFTGGSDNLDSACSQTAPASKKGENHELFLIGVDANCPEAYSLTQCARITASVSSRPGRYIADECWQSRVSGHYGESAQQRQAADRPAVDAERLWRILRKLYVRCFGLWSVLICG